MKTILFYLVIIILMISCKSKTDNNLTVHQIVEKAIEISGKKALDNSTVSFMFRDKKYVSEGHCDHFILSRITTKADTVIKDIYEPEKSFKRYIQDSLIIIPDTVAQKFSESINSVHYFVQLPYRLNDEAVNKTYLGIDSIKGKSYHKIAVNFDKDGGGEDYQDQYMYWFDEKNYKLDYLAYSFVVNGGGIRFREAYNERYIEDIRFVDYKNFKPKSDTIKLENISKAFKNNQLELLSKIENKKIQVEKNAEKC